jgi:hypothetical protein
MLEIVTVLLLLAAVSIRLKDYLRRVRESMEEG